MPNLYNRYVEKSNDTTRKRTNKIILLTNKQKAYEGKGSYSDGAFQDCFAS